MREEPLIPLGMLLTCSAFVGASLAMKRGDHARTNIMFRRRVYAQGFTVLAMVGGSLYLAKDRERRKEWEKVEGEKRDAERRVKWLAELEAREEEDRAVRERAVRLVKRRREREEAAEAKRLAAAAKGEKAQNVGTADKK
jgi:hypothetical protein